MTGWRYLARFFIVVPPMPLLMIGTFVVVTAVAACVIVIDPSRAPRALTPILLLQLFGCSSGFDVPARRGHYDLLLTHGLTRRRIVVGHLVASAFPGLVSWLVVATVCYVTSSGDTRATLFRVGTVTALSLVSTVPWATTVRLPRFSGAIGWLLIVATVSLTVPGALTIDLARSVERRSDWLQTAGALLVYPPLLVGHALEGHDALLVAPALLFATLALAIAIWSINRRDIPLEAAQ
jgi:hypothetical protein